MGSCVTITLLLWASLTAQAQLLPQLDASLLSLSQQQTVHSGREAGHKQWSVRVEPAASSGWLLVNLVVILPGLVLLSAPRCTRPSHYVTPVHVLATCLAIEPIRGP